MYLKTWNKALPSQFAKPARIIGHRGAAAMAPENTLESFAKAAQEGASWVETDVKLTADSVAILMHDDDLDRTTNGSGPVAKASLAEIKKLDAGSWLGRDFAGARIPTLKEMVAFILQNDLSCNFEIKPCPKRDLETANHVMAELKALWPAQRPVPLISSFSRDSLAEAHRVAPDWPKGILLEDQAKDWLEWARSIRAVSIHCSADHLTQAWSQEIKARGFWLLVYTVNDAEVAKRLFAWGVDSVFTDVPGKLLEAGLG